MADDPVTEFPEFMMLHADGGREVADRSCRVPVAVAPS
jgi:hypothetical protein